MTAFKLCIVITCLNVSQFILVTVTLSSFQDNPIARKITVPFVSMVLFINLLCIIDIHEESCESM